MAGEERSVTPSITYAGQYGDFVEIGAYVDGIFENNGTCTATLQKDGVILTKTVTAEKNVRSMDCPVMKFSKSEFTTNGLWTAKVAYSSETAKGTSQERQIEVK